MQKYFFGETKDGRTVNAYILENINGIRVELLDLGCILRQLWLLNRDDSYINVIYGLDSVRQYEDDRFSFKTIDCNIYPASFLQGGINSDNSNISLCRAISEELFNVETIEARTLEEASKGLVFTFKNADKNDHALPLNLEFKLTCILDDDDSFRIIWDLKADEAFYADLSFNCYYNLSADQIITVDPSGKSLCDQGLDEPALLRLDKDPDRPSVTLSSPYKGISLELYSDMGYVLIDQSNPFASLISFKNNGSFTEFTSKAASAPDKRLTFENSLKIIEK